MIRHLHHLQRYLLCSILVFIVLTFFSSHISYAASITVNANCSQADAIHAANRDEAAGGCIAGDGADTISLTDDLTLSELLPVISSEMTITSDDSSLKRTISGNNARRIFRVRNAGNLTINNLILTNGRALDGDHRVNVADRGGAIWIDTAVGLTINNSTIKDSRAAQGGAIFADDTTLTVNNSTFSNNVRISGGGAILNYTEGRITINGSVFTGNSAPGENSESSGSGDGGAIDIGLARTPPSITNSVFTNNSARRDGGAIAYYGISNWLSVRNSTFVGNSARGEGGAIYGGDAHVANSTFHNNSASRKGGAFYVDHQSVLRLVHSTLVGNGSQEGGGIYRDTTTRSDRPAIVYIFNSIVAGSSRGGGCANGFNISSGNFIGDNSCSPAYFGDPFVGTPVTLASGQRYFPLVSGQSRAINNANPAHCLETDQLGNARPLGSACDIGAYENPDAADAPTATVTNTPTITPTPTSTDTPTSTPLPADLALSTACSFADAITAANTDTATGGCPAGKGGADEITLSGNLTFTSNLPGIRSEIYLVGNGYTISGNNSRRIFWIAQGGHLRINNTTLTDGSADAGGAIKVNSGRKLTVTNSTIQNSRATSGDGGAILIHGGNVTISTSTITGNTASGRGAGIGLIRGGRATIKRSAISNNTATGSGGGIYNDWYSTINSHLLVENSTFYGNQGKWGGAIYTTFRGSVTIRFNTIVNNRAVREIGGYMNGNGFRDNRHSVMYNLIANNSEGDCFSWTGTIDYARNYIKDDTCEAS